MTDRMKDLSVRTLSGIALAALVVGATLWSKWSFGALMFFVVIGGTAEFYRLCRRCGIAPMEGMGIVSAAGLFLLSFNVFMQFGGSGVQPSTGAAVLGTILFLLLMVLFAITPAVFVLVWLIRTIKRLITEAKDKTVTAIEEKIEEKKEEHYVRTGI